MSNTTTSIRGKRGAEKEPVRHPPQRRVWTEEEYLTRDINRVIEFSDGRVEVSALPTESHQDISLFLYRALWALVEARRLGKVLHAARPVRLWAR